MLADLARVAFDTQSMHEMEYADYIVTHKDYAESIDALNEDIQTLQAQAHDVKQAAAA